MVQSAFFEVAWGNIGRALFLVVAAAFLCDAWLQLTDGFSRIQADFFYSNFKRAQKLHYPHLVLHLRRHLHGAHHGHDGAGAAGHAHHRPRRGGLPRDGADRAGLRVPQLLHAAEGVPEVGQAAPGDAER